MEKFCNHPQDSLDSKVEEWNMLHKWHQCIVCAKSFISDQAIKRLPCQHLLCGDGDCENNLSTFCNHDAELPRHCPKCGIEYNLGDICTGTEEMEVVKVIWFVIDGKSNCRCGDPVKFKCQDCVHGLFCETCYKHHQRVAVFAGEHTSYQLDDKKYKCTRENCENTEYATYADVANGLPICSLCKTDDDVEWKEYSVILKQKFQKVIASLRLIESNSKRLSQRLMNELNMDNEVEAFKTAEAALIKVLGDTANGVGEIRNLIQRKSQECNVLRLKSFGFASSSIQLIGFLEDILTPFCHYELIKNVRFCERVSEHISNEWEPFYSQYKVTLDTEHSDDSLSEGLIDMSFDSESGEAKLNEDTNTETATVNEESAAANEENAAANEESAEEISRCVSKKFVFALNGNYMPGKLGTWLAVLLHIGLLHLLLCNYVY